MTQPAATGAYQQQSTAARAQLAAVIAALWASLPDYRNESMRLFTAQAVPLVEAAMGHMQVMTGAYLAALAGEAGGSSIPVAAKAVTVASVRNGADPGDVYGRPFHLVWRMLAEHKPLDSAKISLAVLAGETRAVQTAVTDLQLAKTHTAQQVISGDPRAVGYRRVLEGPHSCALCVVASTRRYHKSELLPIHPGCDCSVEPLRAGEAHGPVLDEAQLAAAHAAVAERFGADSTAAREIHGALNGNGDPLLYRDVLITHEHGELGPVIGVRGQAFTGPSAIAH